MSENITHTCIVDDTRRLVFRATEVAGDLLPPLFQRVLEEHHDIMRLGGVTRRADFHSVGLLTEIRDKINNDEMQSKDRGNLAFILGWLSHRAADRQMKPVFRRTCPDAVERPTDCSIYNDAYLYLRRYQGKSVNYTDATFQCMSKEHQLGRSNEELRSLVRALVQGTLIGLHTLIPDDDSVSSWLDKVFEMHQAWRIRMDRYFDAVFNPDEALIQRYIVDENFYDINDSLINYCEALQAESGTYADSLLYDAPDQSSDYAQALEKSWGFIKAAGRFIEGKLDGDELAAALEHGQKLSDGLGG